MASYIRTKPESFCPVYGAKMILRRPKLHQSFETFWGCSQYPDCKGSREVEEVNEAPPNFLPLDSGDDVD